MEKISIIVSIYKVQDYLDECIESIINQTYKALEIIVEAAKQYDKWLKSNHFLILIDTTVGKSYNENNIQQI